MTLRPLMIVLGALLAAPVSAETVLVASMGAPKESQTAIVRALGGRPGVTALVVSPPANGSDPGQRAQLVHERGAAALLLLRVKPGRKALRLELFDTAGKSAWATEMPLKRGKLGGDKKKVAMAIVREVRALPPPSRAPAPPPEPSAAAQPPAAPAPSAPVAEREPPARVPPTPALKKAAPARHRPAAPPPPPVVEVEQPSAGPRSVTTPLVEVSAGGTLVWRSYEFCPGVPQCGQKILGNLPGAARYVTDSPYLGPAVRAAVFPLAGFDSPVRGIGVGGSYARGWLRTAVPGTLPGEVVWLSTTDEDFSVELIFRDALKLGWGEAFAGARGGILGRRFILPENTLLTESRRRVSPAFALELGVPLIAGARLDVTGRYAFAPTPGAAEQAAYGSDAVSSSGLFVSVGLSGQIAGTGWGWAATYEYALFQDAFTGNGDRAAGGAAREQFQGLVAFARYRF